MTDANYIALSKVLGKLAYFFDQAGGGGAGLQQAFAAMYDQVAKPDTPANNEIVVDFAGVAASLEAGINTGSAALQTTLVRAAQTFLVSDLVRSYFVSHAPASNASAAQVVTALIAEATADNVYFTPLASTGIVNFLQQILPGAAIPTTGSGNQYTDATYCVVTVL